MDRRSQGLGCANGVRAGSLLPAAQETLTLKHGREVDRSMRRRPPFQSARPPGACLGGVPLPTASHKAAPWARAASQPAFPVTAPLDQLHAGKPGSGE